MRFLVNTLSSLALSAAVIGMSGCGQQAKPPETPKAAQHTHKHGEWWCSEHGVPEEVCAQCDPKLVPRFKAEGDWCEKHNRPDSQCFIDHPEYQAKFAAQYEAKYGEKPPKLGEEHEHKDDEHAGENKDS